MEQVIIGTLTAKHVLFLIQVKIIKKIFDTLEKWGAEDGDVFAGKVINQKPWETKR